MDVKATLKKRSFWRSVLWLGLSFLVIYNFISLFFEYGGLDFASFYRDKISDGMWIRFAISQLAGGFIYGFILAFGQFHLNQKKR